MFADDIHCLTWSCDKPTIRFGKCVCIIIMTNQLLGLGSLFVSSLCRKHATIEVFSTCWLPFSIVDAVLTTFTKNNALRHLYCSSQYKLKWILRERIWIWWTFFLGTIKRKQNLMSRPIVVFRLQTLSWRKGQFHNLSGKYNRQFQTEDFSQIKIVIVRLNIILAQVSSYLANIQNDLLFYRRSKWNFNLSHTVCQQKIYINRPTTVFMQNSFFFVGKIVFKHKTINLSACEKHCFQDIW